MSTHQSTTLVVLLTNFLLSFLFQTNYCIVFHDFEVRSPDYIKLLRKSFHKFLFYTFNYFLFYTFNNFLFYSFSYFLFYISTTFRSILSTTFWTIETLLFALDFAPSPQPIHVADSVFLEKRFQPTRNVSSMIHLH